MAADTALGGKYKAYSEYKDSGVEWLGPMPIDWDVTKLKYTASIYGRIGFRGYTVSDIVDEGEGAIVLSPSNIEQDRFTLEKRSYLSWDKYYESPEIMVSEGDVLMVKTGSTFGKSTIISLIDEPMTINPQMALIKDSKVDSRFLTYLLNSTLIKAKIEVNNTGSGMPTMTQENINRFPVPRPSDELATQIANFLDHETAKIDTLIEKQQQLIKLLKEKRQAVISHAVTRGLPSTTGSDTPMRDSGVEWLGRVPEHWDVVPLKHLCTLLKDGTHLPPPRVDSGVPLLSVRNIINGKFVFRDDDSNISEKDYESLCRSFIPQQGDVLLAIVGGTIGKVAIIDEMTKFHIQRSVAIFRTNKKILTSELLANIIGSSSFQSLLWENVGFSAQPGIYLGSLANFQLPIPPLNEQNDINEYCSSKSERINILIEKATSAVKLMQERRTALISAAVTGKIDVRDWHSDEEEGS